MKRWYGWRRDLPDARDVSYAVGETRLVCSEALSRILAPQLDLRDLRRSRHDEVNPNSAWRRLTSILAGFPWVNTPPASAPSVKSVVSFFSSSSCSGNAP